MYEVAAQLLACCQVLRPVAERRLDGWAAVGDAPAGVEHDDDVGKVADELPPPLVTAFELDRPPLDHAVEVAGQRNMVGDHDDLPRRDEHADDDRHPDEATAAKLLGAMRHCGPGGERDRRIGQQLLHQRRRRRRIGIVHHLGHLQRHAGRDGDRGERCDPAEVEQRARGIATVRRARDVGAVRQ